MGTCSPVLAKSSHVMRAFAFVLLVAAARTEADADAYTVGVVTGVDYGHGIIPSVGAIGNHAVNVDAPAVHVAAPGAHVTIPHVFSGVHTGTHSRLSSVLGPFYGKTEDKFKLETDPLVYTTGVHAPVGASTYAHGVVAPVMSSVVTPVPRTILIAKIIKIVKIIKDLVACADGEVYEECVEYGDEFGNYVECQQYVDCVATSTLVQDFFGHRPLEVVDLNSLVWPVRPIEPSNREWDASVNLDDGLEVRNGLVQVHTLDSIGCFSS